MIGHHPTANFLRVCRFARARVAAASRRQLISRFHTHSEERV